jgi:hypothetical protein
MTKNNNYKEHPLWMYKQLEYPWATYIHTGLDSGRGEEKQKHSNVICFCFLFVKASVSTVLFSPISWQVFTDERHLASDVVTFHLLKYPNFLHASCHFQSLALCFQSWYLFLSFAASYVVTFTRGVRNFFAS